MQKCLLCNLSPQIADLWTGQAKIQNQKTHCKEDCKGENDIS